MQNPAAFSIERPRVIGLAVVLAVIFGALSYVDLPRQENPAMTNRFASVMTYVPGAEPEKVELLVSKVLEDRIAEIDDIEMIFSRSTNGVSFLLTEFHKDAPLRERMQELKDKVQEARLLLPENASEPDVDTRSLRTNTLVLALVGNGASPPALRHQAKELERALELLSDVALAEILGEPEEEIAVDVDMRRLSQRGVSLPSILQTLAARNVLLTGGELEVGKSRYSIQTTGAFDAVGEVGATYLGASPEGLPILLRDVATVQRRIAEPEVRVRWKGKAAVSIAVEMLPHRNAIEFGASVRRFLAGYQENLAEGMQVEVVADEPYYVGKRLDLLTDSLLFGMALVTVLNLLGMGWRSGLIVSISIPLTLTIAMGLMGIAGMALHQISIVGLVIAIGLIVDEAIVVTDNIQRHRDLGLDARQAAIRGLGEVHMAVLAGAATTVAAFIPLALMKGDIGDFVRSIPLAVSLMLVASIAVAHFVTPLLAVLLHGRFGGQPLSTGWLAGRVEGGYRSVLGAVVGHPRVVLVFFAVTVVVSIGALQTYLLPPVFFPDSDRNQFLVQVYMPAGAPFEETDATMHHVESLLAARPEVANWTTYVGAGAPKFFFNQFTEGQALTTGMVIVNARADLPLEAMRQFTTTLERQLKGEVSGPFVQVQRLQPGYGDEGDVNIFVEGDELEVLRALAVRIRDVVRSVTGTINVRESFGFDPVTLEARVRPARANLLGITHQDIATTLRTALDGAVASQFREGDEEIDIVVRLAEGQRRGIEDLETLPIFSPVASGTVPLAHVASLVPGFATRTILRWNRKREANITADVSGRPVFTVTGDIEKAVRERVRLPPGYAVTFEGERKEVTESFLSLARAAVVAIFLIYIILVLRFHSLTQPLLIVLAIPMALIGSIWGLIATSNPLGFTAFLGMISLTGIVVNDSIILLDYINTLRERGTALTEAVMAGAVTRLRAITLTTVTTIGGLLPLSLGGGEMFGPFASTMIFGLATSMALTLLVQPAAYLALERRMRRQTRFPAEAITAAPPLAS